MIRQLFRSVSAYMPCRVFLYIAFHIEPNIDFIHAQINTIRVHHEDGTLVYTLCGYMSEPRHTFVAKIKGHVAKKTKKDNTWTTSSLFHHVSTPRPRTWNNAVCRMGMGHGVWHGTNQIMSKTNPNHGSVVEGSKPFDISILRIIFGNLISKILYAFCAGCANAHTFVIWIHYEQVPACSCVFCRTQ